MCDLMWWFASLKNVCSYMAPNVLTETRCYSTTPTKPVCDYKCTLTYKRIRKKNLQIYRYAVYMITFITVRDKKIIKCVLWCPLNILISVLLIVHILVHVLFSWLFTMMKKMLNAIVHLNFSILYGNVWLHVSGKQYVRIEAILWHSQ